MNRTPQRSCAARGVGCLITQAYPRYVYVSAKTMSGNGQDDLSSRKAPPSPGGGAGAKPRTAIRLMPRAESPVRPSNAPCPNVSREPRPAQNVCHGPLIALGRAAGTRVRPGGCQPRRGPDAPDVSQDSASFVLGADVAWCRAAAALGREGGRSRRRPSVSDCYLACGRARRRPSITADWTAA
jgi:hypothetical protein